MGDVGASWKCRVHEQGTAWENNTVRRPARGVWAVVLARKSCGPQTRTSRPARTSTVLTGGLMDKVRVTVFDNGFASRFSDCRSSSAQVRGVFPRNPRACRSTSPSRRRRSIRCRWCTNFVGKPRLHHKRSPPDMCRHRQHRLSRNDSSDCTPAPSRSRCWFCSRERTTCVDKSNSTSCWAGSRRS